ncbi:AimR family lysis-lysogeny pheromone receptor [Bacillus cereus]|uniref:AimR family lysis-lysogeny pheromone receptor n=1 Tax=Bacillus cereus TaxID=1396 RepID=UPI001C0B384D|nr:AimR family lysis-lysogeny pheromone receptor [Bacillus cereus]QWS00176.1 winged helix-turn-helix domain-containing protein [Bacillus cereus]
MDNILVSREKDQVMTDLLRKINDDLFALKITNNELASYLGIAKSTVSSILSRKTEISFNYLIKIIMKIYKKPYVTLRDDIISDYLMYAKPENRREALEYAAFRREFDSLKVIIDIEKSSNTEINREFAKIYEIVYKHCKDVEEYSPEDFYDELEECKSHVLSWEMKVLIDILLCQTLYQTKEYKKLFKRISIAKKNVKEIKNKFIYNSFLVRIKEVLIVTYMMQNEVRKARLTCIELMGMCDGNSSFFMQKANSYYNMGESYIFEDYSKAKMFLEKSLSVLSDEMFTGDKDIERKTRRIKSTIIFLKIHHYQDIKEVYSGLDKDGHVYLELQKGNKEQAEMYLLEIEKENGALNEFQTCYMGLARNDKSLIEKSYMMFLQKKSLFYANLPKLYLGDF